jgi:hypothetical protein
MLNIFKLLINSIYLFILLQHIFLFQFNYVISVPHFSIKSVSTRSVIIEVFFLF